MEDIEKPSADIFSTIPKDETATIIIPLYGFLKEQVVPDLTVEVLNVALFRLRSFFHKVSFVFVGEKGRVDDKVLNALVNRKIQRDTKGVEVEAHATYAMYLNEGIRYALENTTSKYFICANPWVMFGKDAIDVLLERINRVDVSVCSGFDLRKDNIPAADFDSHRYNPAQEFIGFDINLFGFTRPVAEQLTIDVNYQTKEYLRFDISQYIHSKAQNVISSQAIPIYSLDIDWSTLEGEDETNADKARFQEKWGFIPS